MKIEYSPIGFIHTPFTKPEGMPIQPAGAKGIAGTVDVYEAYAAGLKDLDGFSHIILIYYFHRASDYQLEIVPFLDTKSHGVFATRAPKRPNAIGLSIVRLIRVDGRILHIEDIDVLDNTPLLDIKPYVPDFDAVSGTRIGWLENIEKNKIKQTADGRFSK